MGSPATCGGAASQARRRLDSRLPRWWGLCLALQIVTVPIGVVMRFQVLQRLKAYSGRSLAMHQ